MWAPFAISRSSLGIPRLLRWDLRHRLEADDCKYNISLYLLKDLRKTEFRYHVPPRPQSEYKGCLCFLKSITELLDSLVATGGFQFVPEAYSSEVRGEVWFEFPHNVEEDLDRLVIGNKIGL